MNTKTHTKSQTKNTLRIFGKAANKYPFALWGMVFFVAAAVTTDTYRPLLYKRFFDNLNVGSNTGSVLITVIMAILALNVLNWIFWRLATFAAVYHASRVMSDLVNTCFDYVHGHAYTFFNNTFVGSLVRKVTRYARSYEDFSDQFIWDIGPTTLTIGFITVVLYGRSPLLAWIIVAWAFAYIFVNYFLITYKLKFDIKRAELDTAVSGHLADTITNHSNLQLFNGLVAERKTFRKLTKDLQDMRSFSWNLDNTIEAVQGGLMVALEFGVMYYAVQLWQEGRLTIGDFALIQAYLLRMFQSLWDVGKHIRRIFTSLADAAEMTEILMTPHQIVDAPHATTLVMGNGEIVFKDVNFSYNDKNPILKNFQLTITAGERVALIGPSGGGKSTITKLLLRFFDIQSGQILIDNQSIAEVTQKSLREAISLVPQDPILFHRSLFDNIQYARPSASHAEVIEAAKLAHCHEFIMSFPEKYNTFVGERGVKLSGGERQRVAIARAILKNAPILILDEATSSLDSESERYIQDALKSLMKGKTTIVIAHRLSTVMQMDRIIVIQNGKITEEGGHEELLKLEQGTYQKLWGIQAGGFTK